MSYLVTKCVCIGSLLVISLMMSLLIINRQTLVMVVPRVKLLFTGLFYTFTLLWIPSVSPNTISDHPTFAFTVTMLGIVYGLSSNKCTAVCITLVHTHYLGPLKTQCRCASCLVRTSTGQSITTLIYDARPVKIARLVVFSIVWTIATFREASFQYRFFIFWHGFLLNWE